MPITLPTNSNIYTPSDPRKLTVQKNSNGMIGPMPSVKPPVVSSNSGATSTKPTAIIPPSVKTPAAQSYIQSLSAPTNLGSYKYDDSPAVYGNYKGNSDYEFHDAQEFLGAGGNFADVQVRSRTQPGQTSTQANPSQLNNQPNTPTQPSATDLAFASYLKSLQPSEDVTNAKTAYNDYVASAELGIKKKEGQGRGIPLELVRGQQRQLADQAEIEAKRLQGDINIAQDTQTGLQNATKAGYDYNLNKDALARDAEKLAYDRSKPTEVGGALIKLNPTTGKYETVYEAPVKAEAKPASVQEYEYAKGQGYAGTYQDYQNEDANRKALASSVIGSNGLNPTQTQNFLRISDKYQADEIIKNGDKAISANSIADQVLANPKSAGNQLKILYTLVKNLDPDSAVREGELDLASKIQSYTGKFSTSLARISEGRLLDEKATIELANATKDLAQVWVDAMNRRNNQYDSQSVVSGIGDAWTQYKTGFGGTSSPSSGGGTPDDLINKYLPGFKPVGNTSASFIGPIQFGSPLAKANNNPGNLRFVGQAGATQGTGGFAKFATPEAGVKALQNQIKLDASRGLTLQSFINKYAPPVENNTSLYVQQAVKNLGVPANTPLKNIDLNKITKFMALKESSTKIG